MEKFQVPVEFQPSFTQIPLLRINANQKIKVTQLSEFPIRCKTLLPTLKARNSCNTLKKTLQDKEWLVESLKINQVTNTKPAPLSSSQVFSKPSESHARFNRYKEFLREVNLSNGVVVNLDSEGSKKYIYSVGKGNNNILVLSMLKSRFWWVEGTPDCANFVWTQTKKLSIFEGQSTQDNKENRENKDPRNVSPHSVHNHLPNNDLLGNKKSLYQNLRAYCQKEKAAVFDLVPLTFYIGPELSSFLEEFNRREALNKNGSKTNNIWIIKPGENSNRGQNIVVIDSLTAFDEILSKKNRSDSVIAQLYIDKPFLYNRRKFDIRHYMMITSVGGIKAYWYKDGYIRTSSHIFEASDIGNQEMHLTNDAIQVHSDKYGKYEEGNKLSYKEFQRYLNMAYPDRKYDFERVLLQMKEIATHAVKSSFSQLNPDKKEFNFEIFGLDFMLDEDLRPWLIEINTNPCLEVSSRVLNSVIPPMLENSFRLGLDPLFPPPSKYPNSHKHSIPEVSPCNLKYQLIFDSQKAE